MPGHFSFSCTIPVRITDINYGGHAGNDSILAIIHEARMQFLQSLSYTEMNFAGAGIIMADVSVEFKHELFYGDFVIASVNVCEIFKIGFELVYKFEKNTGDQLKIIAVAKTRLICYDYDRKKIIALPDNARKKLIVS